MDLITELNWMMDILCVKKDFLYFIPVVEVTKVRVS